MSCRKTRSENRSSAYAGVFAFASTQKSGQFRRTL